MSDVSEELVNRTDQFLGRLVRLHPERLAVPIQETPAPMTQLVERVVYIPTDRALTFKGDEPPIKLIIEEVAEFYEVHPLAIVGQRRTRGAIRPRHIAMYLAREMTTRSFPQIAVIFGDRDHTTIHHGHRNICHAREADDRLRDEIDVLRLRIRSRRINAEVAA